MRIAKLLHPQLALDCETISLVDVFLPSTPNPKLKKLLVRVFLQCQDLVNYTLFLEGNIVILANFFSLLKKPHSLEGGFLQFLVKFIGLSNSCTKQLYLRLYGCLNQEILRKTTILAFLSITYKVIRFKQPSCGRQPIFLVRKTVA